MPDNITGGTPGEGAPSETQAPNNQLNYDEWLAGQDETVRAMLDGHIAGLKSALAAERSQRADLAHQVKDLVAKTESGSETEKALTELQERLEFEQRRAAFYEDAGRAEIACANPKAAFLIAQAESLFDRRGNPDWAAIKAAAPELFRRPSAPSNAGAGTGSPPTPAIHMNDLIRRAAGR